MLVGFIPQCFGIFRRKERCGGGRGKVVGRRAKLEAPKIFQNSKVKNNLKSCVYSPWHLGKYLKIIFVTQDFSSQPLTSRTHHYLLSHISSDKEKMSSHGDSRNWHSCIQANFKLVPKISFPGRNSENLCSSPR